MSIEEKKRVLAKLLNIEAKKNRLLEIEKEMAKSDFWADREKANQISKDYANLREEIREFEAADSEEKLNNLEVLILFSGKYDPNNAIVEISAGTGGVEAQDWAEMLLRMYLRCAERKGLKATVVDKNTGTEAGIKNAIIIVKGHNAFGLLKSESGVHRLVRQSPFNAQHLRQTSFALVDVTPEIESPKELEIKDEDLRIDTFRSSGHGGQSVNTTDSAVRITHLPSKIVVSVQNERSQLQNKETAMKILRSKLAKLQSEEHKKEVAAAKGETKQAAWGNQIRSYVLHPYKMVKDHRTNFESKDAEVVLDGNIDGFIQSYLEWSSQQK
ncbi:MAG: peptide chain release factor 2 [Candidatus Berkelbacteria bacterium]|nr:peptide chain release factor 2 [Candidatus Berkelbacteria bacterium]